MDISIALSWFFVSLLILFLSQQFFHYYFFRLLQTLSNDSFIVISVYFILLFPGILLHEISHWLGAAILRIKVASFSVWPKIMEDGSLQLGKVDIYDDNTFRTAFSYRLISLTPIFMGITILALLISNRIAYISQLEEMSNLSEMLVALIKDTSAFYWYAIFAVGNTMFPSWGDLSGFRSNVASIVSIVFVGAVTYVGFFMFVSMKLNNTILRENIPSNILTQEKMQEMILDIIMPVINISSITIGSLLAINILLLVCIWLIGIISNSLSYRLHTSRASQI